MKKIVFWSPYLSHVATIGSVLKSALSMSKYSNLEYKPIIIDAFGEWSNLSKTLENYHIDYVKITNQKIFNFKFKQGFLLSRLYYCIIFILNFFPLLKFLKKNNPDYLIAHLITSLPIFLFGLFNFKTKLILRISGLPKLNFFRLNLWKFFGKNIYHVTCPTEETKSKLINLKIFPNEKVSLVEDPILEVTKIARLKKEKIEIKNLPNSFFLCIGRLTKQKNHILAINAIQYLKNDFPDIKLCIIGEGENEALLKTTIRKNNLDNNIFLLGKKKNVFPYIAKSDAILSTSLWEDPGAVMIEAAFMNKTIIVSDCPSGPKEFIENNLAGYLFKNNNVVSLISSILKFKNEDEKILFLKKKNAKKKTKNYSLFYHFKKIKKILR